MITFSADRGASVMEQMRILLADSQPQVRSALRLLLEHEPDMTVVGEVAAESELLARVSVASPDLLLVAWELPGLSPAALRRLHALCPRARIIALSGRPEARSRALGAGVDAFVSKGEPPDVLLGTLRRYAAPLAGSPDNGSHTRDSMDRTTRS